MKNWAKKTFRIRLFIIFSLISASCFAQQAPQAGILKVKIEDSLTSKPINRATVSTGKQSFLANENGDVDIPKAVVDNTSMLTISCIGYQTVNCKVYGNNEFPVVIKLRESITSLQEVRVSDRKDWVLGQTRGKYLSHRISDPNNAYVQYIPNDSHIEGIITSITYNINDELKGINQPFRVRLFTKFRDSLILDKELTADSIVVVNKQRKPTVTVDMLKYNIRLPENGVMVVFELLPQKYYPIYGGGRDNSLYYHTPGIDIYLKNKDDYAAHVFDRRNRTAPYAMVGHIDDRAHWDDDTYGRWYVYDDGINFAISISVQKD